MSRVKIGVKKREKGRKNSSKHDIMLKENPSFQASGESELESWKLLEGFSLDFEAPLKSFSRCH